MMFEFEGLVDTIVGVLLNLCRLMIASGLVFFVFSICVRVCQVVQPW